MIEKLLSDWDGENVIIRYDRPTGAWIFIAIHSTRLGPAMGGTRMRNYPNPEAALDDVLRLAAAMTYKYAVPGIPRGGGKAVITIPMDLAPESRTNLLRSYGQLVRQLGGLFSTGPDVGTDSADMDIIAETGAPYIHCRTSPTGGAGSPGPITALGVFAGIQVACEHIFGSASLKGQRVLVQGTGSVGTTLIELLQTAGAEVLFSEVDEKSIHHFRDKLGLEFIPSEAVYTTDCDVFAPCALGSVLSADTIPRLKCRIVAGGANNQLADPQDAELLRAKEILYAPDYVINSGAVMAIPEIESRVWSPAEAEKKVVESIGRALRKVFKLAAQKNITPEAAARLIAEDHLSAKT